MYWNAIEMNVAMMQESWIVTLDVLKCHYEMDTVQGKQGWIVTLDVLKYHN